MEAGYFRKRLLVVALTGAIAAGIGPPSEARVTRIIIDATGTLTGQDIPYQTLTGRAFGELDPNDAHNTLITDIALAPRNAQRQGRVHRELLHRQAGRHVAVERPDVARRAQPRRPNHDHRRSAQLARRRTLERLAGRQRRRQRRSRPTRRRCRPVTPVDQRVGQGAGAHRRDRADLRPHHQSQRPRTRSRST